MERIKPYSNKKDALQSLDNGGQFYNFFTKAEDGIISESEVGKVGGLFNDKQKLMLFLELSLSELNSTDQHAIISMLDDRLTSAHQKYKIRYLSPSEAQSEGEIASSAIITGFPKLVDSHSDFTGFIMIPIMTGSVTTFTMIPITEQYDVYEVRDEESSETFIIAHSKSLTKLPEQKLKIAGVFKELKAKQFEEAAAGKFLEAVYYLES